jgi:transcription elongation GreA/GreB family factor
VGQALIGHKGGDVVDVKVPAGLIQFKVLEISK